MNDDELVEKVVAELWWNEMPLECYYHDASKEVIDDYARRATDLITLIREQIAKDIEAYAKTQEKTMQKATYQCAAIARGKVGE